MLLGRSSYKNLENGKTFSTEVKKNLREFSKPHQLIRIRAYNLHYFHVYLKSSQSVFEIFTAFLVIIKICFYFCALSREISLD